MLPSRSNRLISRLGSLLFGALSLSAGMGHGETLTDGVTGVVNGEPITFLEINRFIYPKEDEARKQFQGKEFEQKLKAIRRQGLEDLIDQKLIVEAFRRLGGVIPPEYAEQQIKEAIKTLYQGEEGLFRRSLAAYGETEEEYRQALEEQGIVAYMTKTQVDDKVIATIPADREKEGQTLRKKWLEGLRKDATIQRLF